MDVTRVKQGELVGAKHLPADVCPQESICPLMEFSSYSHIAMLEKPVTVLFICYQGGLSNLVARAVQNAITGSGIDGKVNVLSESLISEKSPSQDFPGNYLNGNGPDGQPIDFIVPIYPGLINPIKDIVGGLPQPKPVIIDCGAWSGVHTGMDNTKINDLFDNIDKQIAQRR